MIDIEDIHTAATRIEGNIRLTPMIAATNLKTPLTGSIELMLKLELLQVTGSFKARGATNKLLSLDRAAMRGGIVAASGGNHGIATARAGFMAGVPTTIFLPSSRAGQDRKARGMGRRHSHHRIGVARIQ